MPKCLIGLGSNLGDRAALLDAAVALLAANPHVAVQAQSSRHETRPAGGPADQGSFLNAAVVAETSLSSQELLTVLQNIEVELGRQRAEFWGPRSIDLDLLLFDEVVLNTPTLVLPHPRMEFRRFVLAPAAEVAAEMLHPTTGWMIRRLLEHLNTAANYVAITGNDDASCGKLALEVGARTGARRVTLGDRGADETALLDRATALLENKTWSADAPWTVSDFWFDELLVRARCNLAPSAVATYELAWRAARSRVVPQKLLVVVGDSELRTHSSQPDRGPVLHLDSSDWARAVEETAAAIQAMS